ncbi:OmpA family protein [Pontibacter sp. H249]|uniref:OmpA family protein n=1 Tax=Pontibacter sp. H249 TaxID=3133420 RepID=UPI0030BFCA40
MSKTVKGGVIGAVVGGVAGGFIGNKKKNTAGGAIIGAAVGGAAGAVIGRYMDKQAAELQRELANAKVERVGEGIKITFDSGILFDTNSDRLSYAAQRNITDLSKTLKKYKDTNVVVEGHTDANGTDAYNQSLSERRATSVYRQLSADGVTASRVTAQGYGESMPVASNSTAVGMQKNRRVEVAIFANEKLKKAAEKGQI